MSSEKLRKLKRNCAWHSTLWVVVAAGFFVYWALMWQARLTYTSNLTRLEDTLLEKYLVAKQTPRRVTREGHHSPSNLYVVTDETMRVVEKVKMAYYNDTRLIHTESINIAIDAVVVDLPLVPTYTDCARVNSTCHQYISAFLEWQFREDYSITWFVMRISGALLFLLSWFPLPRDLAQIRTQKEITKNLLTLASARESPSPTRSPQRVVQEEGTPSEEGIPDPGATGEKERSGLFYITHDPYTIRNRLTGRAIAGKSL